MENYTYYQWVSWEVWILEEGDECQEEILRAVNVTEDPETIAFINSCWIEERNKQIFYILNWFHG